MTRSEYTRIFADSLIDYGKAVTNGTLKERDDCFRLCLDLIRDREEFHEREAEYSSSKVYDAGRDMAVPFYGRGA